MNTQQLQEEIARLAPWHHDVEIVSGIRTSIPVAYPPELGSPSVLCPSDILKMLANDLFPQGFAGRSVLDCACNAGGYLFAAVQLGAGRCFGFDVREHWIAQAQFLSEHLPSENIKFATLDLADLPSLGHEPFDVTLFNGIFYHLPDPVAGLRIAADLTKELLIVNTATMPGPGNSLVLSQESTTQVMSGVHGLAWMPTNDTVLRDILAWCGFPHTRLRYEQEPKTVGGSGRIEIIAAREARTLKHYGPDTKRAIRSPQQNGSWARRMAEFTRCRKQREERTEL